jgi:hypothetical protein
MPVKEDLLQVSEVTIMKLRAIAIAAIVALNCVAASAMSGEPTEAREHVNAVSGATFAGCNPSQDPNSVSCQELLAAALAEFTPRQLERIHWATTTNQALLGTGAMEILLNRYSEFLTRYEQWQALSGRHQGNDAKVVTR